MGQYEILKEVDNTEILIHLLFDWLEDSVEFIIDPLSISKMMTKDIKREIEKTLSTVHMKSLDNNSYDNCKKIMTDNMKRNLKRIEFEVIDHISHFMKLIKPDYNDKKFEEKHEDDFINLLDRFSVHLLGYPYENAYNTKVVNFPTIYSNVTNLSNIMRILVMSSNNFKDDMKSRRYSIRDNFSRQSKFSKDPYWDKKFTVINSEFKEYADNLKLKKCEMDDNKAGNLSARSNKSIKSSSFKSDRSGKSDKSEINVKSNNFEGNEISKSITKSNNDNWENNEKYLYKLYSVLSHHFNDKKKSGVNGIGNSRISNVNGGITNGNASMDILTDRSLFSITSDIDENMIDYMKFLIDKKFEFSQSIDKKRPNGKKNEIQEIGNITDLGKMISTSDNENCISSSNINNGNLYESADRNNTVKKFDVSCEPSPIKIPIPSPNNENNNIKKDATKIVINIDKIENENNKNGKISKIKNINNNKLSIEKSSTINHNFRSNAKLKLNSNNNLINLASNNKFNDSKEVNYEFLRKSITNLKGYKKAQTRLGLSTSSKVVTLVDIENMIDKLFPDALSRNSKTTVKETLSGSSGKHDMVSDTIETNQNLISSDKDRNNIHTINETKGPNEISCEIID